MRWNRWDVTLRMYPRDRVALNQMARILFLKRKYARGGEGSGSRVRVDPEDLQMHYTLHAVLSRPGRRSGRGARTGLFRRFKAEESAQAITAKPRLLSPEDNNERQPIHDHESVPLKACRGGLRASVWPHAGGGAMRR